MPTSRKTNQPAKPQRPPATTPEGREHQLIALAMDVAEKQMREGTASSQVITQFLKLGSSRERLEQDKLAQETAWNAARIEAMASQARVEELYNEALNAMRSYAGQEPMELDDGYED
jgi:hypothetical protein